MGNTTVSVIIPFFEKSDLIRNTISSICAQRNFDATEIEVLVVDATKTTDSREIIGGLSICKIISNPNLNTEADAFTIGIEQAKGKYISFMECGDTLSKDFFADCTNVLERCQNVFFAVTQSFCINPVFNENKPSRLNLERFDFDEIINVKYTPQYIHATIYDAVFRTEVLKGRKFNNILKYEYQQKFILEMLLKNPRYAVAKNAVYYYFMPREDNFQYYLPANYKDWYTDSIKNFLLPLIEKSRNTKGKIPGFIQFYVMYALQSRFLSNLNNRNKKNMDDRELAEFISAVSEMLGLIDDIYIINKDKSKILSYSEEAGKMFLQIKYGLDNALPLNYVEGNKEVYLNFNDISITRLSAQRAAMHVIDYRDGTLLIDGSFREVFNTSDLKMYAVFNGIRYDLADTDRYSLTKYFGISAYKKFTFHLELKLDPNIKKQTLCFFAKVRNTTVQLNYSFIHHWSKFTVSPKNSYWRFADYIAKIDDGNTLVIEKSSALKTFVSELKFLPGVFIESKRCFIIRILYWLTKPFFVGKRIWLMYDKLYKGGDSSEYLYRYSAHFKDGITKYYVIDKNTSDYKNLKRDGFKPVKNGSLKHKMAFLNSDIVLITNSNVFPFNRYSIDRSRFIRGLCNFSSMCLQHGLSVQKCAMAQQRIVDNTTRYFLASHHEYKNLSNHVYNYKGFDILKLTGIGRYDGLINDDQKQILISPTWRMYNAMPVTTSEGEQRDYNPEFKHTTYYKIYNDLINNKKLISTAKKTGYKIKYLLHPILSSQVNDFTPDEYVDVISSVGDLSYEKILTQSSLMVTDYSGVQFDFAYMKKPLVYFHPAQLPAHYEDGGFFYDTMGFGEICTESDQLVDLLCEYMEQGCVMKQKYVDRVEEFYEFDDHNNCQRIYDEIIRFQEQVDIDKLRKR